MEPITQPPKVLHYQEAKCLLNRLPPDSEKYRQLHRAILQGGMREVPLLNRKICADQHSLLGGFGSSEHMAIAKGTTLPHIGIEPLLQKGQTSIHFHHIIALAGDYYGVYGKAIAAAETIKEKRERFLEAFATLEKANCEEIEQLILLIEQDFQQDERSALPHHCYSSQLSAREGKLKKIKPDVGELLIDNSDHFYKQAKKAYRIGHTLAIEEARKAKGQPAGLKRAYAMDAFACHFLTDLFASGHLRNQRLELEIFLKQIGFGIDLAKKFAGILTGAQHEKDGAEGLNVKNGRREYWRAYGDGCYRTPKNAYNKTKAIEATQSSIDEVYAAFSSNLEQVSKIKELFPEPTEENPFPLYEVQDEIENETAIKALYIYQDASKIKIKNKKDFILKALNHALTHVPEQYQNEFLDSTMCSAIRQIFGNKLVDSAESLVEIAWPIRAACAQLGRLEGQVWSIIGLSSRLQIEEFRKEFTSQIEEIAQSVQATQANGVEILEKLECIEKQINEGLFRSAFQPLHEHIGCIKREVDLFNTHKDLDEKDLRRMATELLKSYSGIASIFKSRTGEGLDLLKEYTKVLISNGFPQEKSLITITHWFSQMLEYQKSAFRLHCLIQHQLGRVNRVKTNQMLSEFMKSLETQIEINGDKIRVDLIYCTTSYIETRLIRQDMLLPKTFSKQKN